MVRERERAMQHFGATDVCLDRKSGVVHWIHIRASGTKTVVSLYDGTDAAGDKMFTAEVAASPSSMYRFKPCLSYDKGVFVEVDTNTADYTISYEQTD